MNRRRSWLTALLAGMTLILPMPAAVGANTGFSVSADRSAIPLGTPTAVRVTIRPDVQSDVDNHCYAFGVPATFTILSATIATRPPGSNWSAVLQSGNLELRANGDSVIEDPHVLTVAMTVRGNTPGSYTWVIGGYDKNVCQSGALKEQRSIGMAITAAPAPTASPTPPSTPQPTARPTAQPTPVPQPQPPATPGPAASQPTGQPPNQTPGPTGSPAPSGSAEPTPTETPTAPQGGSGTGPGRWLEEPQSGGDPPDVAPPDPQLATVSLRDGSDDSASLNAQLASQVMSAMAMLNNPFEWFVPGATLGVPAVLILVVLGLQVVGGIMFTPAIRRVTDEERPPRRPLRPDWLPPPAS